MDIPYAPNVGGITACPKTKFVDTKLELPSALKRASLFANIFTSLSSQNAIISVSLVCNNCIDPYSGFKSFVIFSPIINWFNLLTPFLLLYMPEYINPVFSVSSW